MIMKYDWDVMSWSRGTELFVELCACGGRAGGVCKAREKYGTVDIEAINKYELNGSVM